MAKPNCEKCIHKAVCDNYEQWLGDITGYENIRATKCPYFLDQPDVVHCRDCEMRQNKDMLLPSGLTERVCFCTYWQSRVYPEDFCSYGVRKEAADET